MDNPTKDNLSQVLVNPRYAVGDTVHGRLLWGDGSIVEGKVLETDAGISRAALVVAAADGKHYIMLEQSIVEPEPCPSCGGRGWQNWEPMVSGKVNCDRCHGKGKLFR